MAWYNSSWTKRKPITLTGGASGAQTDYQVQLTVTWDSDMKVDFSDLRFTKADGTTLLDAWMESYTASTSAVVWVETDTPANTVDADIYCYYGNSGASSAWDIDATMLFGDDFPGSSLDTAKWTATDVTTAVSSGILTLSSFTGSRYVNGILGKTLIASPATVEYRVNCVNDGDAAWLGMAESQNMVASDDRVAAGFYTLERFYRMSKNGGTGTEDVSGTFTNNVYHKMRCDWISGTENHFFYDDVERGTKHTTNIPNVSMYAWVGSDTTYSPTLYIDWVIAHKYCASPATYAFGSEESTTGWANKIIGITSPGKVIAIANASIGKIMGV